MTDLLTRLDGGEFLGFCGILLALVGIVGGISVAITKVVAAHMRKSQLDEMEATLKMEMIQRGMSAGDIKQVLEAKMGGSKTNPFVEMWANPPVRVADFFGKCASNK
jgi:hypothetical protein